MSDHPHPHRPARPESPRRPSTLDPLPNRPTSANRLAPTSSPRAPSPGSPGRSIDLQGELHSWLATHMPPSLNAGLTSWCSTNAEPLLGGFLEEWMKINSAQVLANELQRHLIPMQQAMQTQQTMIAELQTSVQGLQNTVHQLENTVTTQASKISTLEQRSKASNGIAEPPAPFAPTLPFTLTVASAATSSPSTSGSLSASASPSTSSHGLGLGLGLGLGKQNRLSIQNRTGGSGLNEDGVDEAADVKALVRKNMRRSVDVGGLRGGNSVNPATNEPRGPISKAIESATTSPGPGETITSEEGHSPQGGKKVGLTNAGRQTSRGTKVTGPIDIIVVDDLDLALKIAHAALTRGHYKVDVASDGLSAIELFKKNMGSLKAVLMDIHLPGISGIETTERIRKLEVEAGVQPVYIYGLTGDVGEDDLVKYKACGMNGCILKGKLLADAVKQAMEESQNGVEFVNLCDKQGGAKSSSSSSAVASAGAATGAQVAKEQQNDKSQATIDANRSSSSSSSSTSSVGAFGTPRAPLPRQLMLDNKYPGRGVVRPSVGLPSAGGGQSNSGPNSPVTTLTSGERLQSAGPNMLLVEDVRVSQKIALQALQRAGFKVIAADNGESAVEKWKQHQASLRFIIMDINLPGISGIEATEQVRAAERASGTSEPVFIFGLTGNVDPESMRNYESAGMNGCILKGKVLAEAVKLAIEEAQEGRFVNIS